MAASDVSWVKRMGEKLGLQPTAAEVQKAELERYTTARAAAADGLEELKNDIRRTENGLLRMEQELARLKQANGDTAIVIAQIDQGFKKLDSFKERRDVLLADITRLDAIIEKRQTLALHNTAAEAYTVTDLDKLAADAEKFVGEQTALDNSMTYVAQPTYRRTEASADDVQRRLDQLHGRAAPAPSAPELAAETLKRLEALKRGQAENPPLANP